MATGSLIDVIFIPSGWHTTQVILYPYGYKLDFRPRTVVVTGFATLLNYNSGLLLLSMRKDLKTFIFDFLFLIIKARLGEGAVRGG